MHAYDQHRLHQMSRRQRRLVLTHMNRRILPRSARVVALRLLTGFARPWRDGSWWTALPAVVLAVCAAVLTAAGDPESGRALLRNLATGSAMLLALTWALDIHLQVDPRLHTGKVFSPFVFLVYAILGAGLAAAAEAIRPPLAGLFVVSFAFAMMLANALAAHLVVTGLRALLQDPDPDEFNLDINLWTLSDLPD